MTDIAMILQRVGATLVTDVAPKLEGDYAAGHANMAGLLAGMAGDLWDRQADILSYEIKGLQALLEAGSVEPAMDEPASLKISDLKAVRNALAAQLIELQTRLEQAGDDASAELNAKIWSHLLATSVARMPNPPQFGED